MGFKEELDREKSALLTSKRPYETAAFVIFAILFLQQLFYLGRSLWKFIDGGTNFITTNITAVGNMQAFFNRTVFVDSSKWLYVLAAIFALALYYFIVYLFVWNYCRKRGKAKWTWTVLIVFGPNILFMPPYIFYAVYLFRNYFFRFIKSIVEEYKAFDPAKLAAEELALKQQEDEEAKEREIKRDKKAQEKEEKEKEKQEEKAKEEVVEAEPKEEIKE